MEDVPGGTGHPRSRELVTAIVWRLVAINAVASALGQVYSDLLRSAKARSIVFPHTAVVVAGACAFAVLLLFSTRRARPVVGSEFSPRGAAITGVIFLGVLGVSAWFSHPGQFAHRSRLEILLIDVPAAMIWVAVVGVGAWRRAQRVFGPQLHWLDAGVAPSDEERTALVRMPSAIALFYLPYWAALGVLNFVGDSLTPRLGGAIGAAVLIGTLATWLATAGITYLLAELRLRPVFAQALQAGPRAELATLGVRKRLLLAWALGSGIPFAFVAFTPGALSRGRMLGDHVAVAATFVLLGAIGLVAGFLTTRAAARSLADPMAQVRVGLERVREGDLSTELEVDDAGEVGLVMAGFNEMVTGLRERAILQDLFGRHVGADVARRALQEGTALGGEQREITVFFVDIIGSTALAEASSPAEVVALLNRFFAAVVKAVSAEGGWVNKFEGDGALCVFGAPAAQPDHAARALRAACALRNALIDVADAGIGVATGDAVVGNVGAEERYEYTVVGRPVNAASRLTGEAKLRPTRVLATADTMAAASSEAANWIEVGFVELRGLAGPVLAYEPLAAPLKATLVRDADSDEPRS